MSTGRTINKLHLPDLSISGFGGIRQLNIGRLGRVTLFAGRNGSGKTTLLDAVRVYAARGSWPVLITILERREELTQYTDEDGDESLGIRWESLFFGRRITPNAVISIGPLKPADQLNMRVDPATDEEAPMFIFSGNGPLDDDWWMLRVEYRCRKQSIPMTPDRVPGRPRNLASRRQLSARSESLPQVSCESVGPGLLSNRLLSRLWARVALTDSETKAVRALNLTCGDNVERVALIGGDQLHNRLLGDRVVVKLKGKDGPVPLKSLGDGAVRLFSVALALANSKDGFLIIDEVENGIHHSVQHDFWRMVLRTAHENNVQVFATTHGWDCVVGYAKAARDVEEVDGALIRIERTGDQTRAVEYTEDDLDVVAEQGIEVR